MTPVFEHGALRLYLLKLLAESPRHGYDLIKALSSGAYTPSAGTIYPRLARMERDGLVERYDEGGRKTYRITDAGRAELAARTAELAEIESSVAALAREIRTDVRASVRELRDELRAAAKDARTDPLARDLDAFVREVRSLTRRTRDDAKLAEIREVLRDALVLVRQTAG